MPQSASPSAAPAPEESPPQPTAAADSAAAPCTIMEWLTARYPEARRNTLRRMVENHAVTLHGKVVRSLKQPLSPQDQPMVGEAVRTEAPFRGGLKIVHQDADILIVRKPAGLLTSTVDAEPRPTVIALLQERMNRKNQKMSVHLVHRLDRDASGLLVLARGVRPLAELKMQFRRHTIIREYELIVHGTPNPPQARLEHHLLEQPGGRVVVCSDEQGKSAILHYQVLRTHGDRSHVRCRLFTGRKHQIRVQFAAIGHPLVGDRVYGTSAARKEKEGRLALHATRLEFVHPRLRKTVVFTSPLPETILTDFARG